MVRLGLLNIVTKILQRIGVSRTNFTYLGNFRRFQFKFINIPLLTPCLTFLSSLDHVPLMQTTISTLHNIKHVLLYLYPKFPLYTSMLVLPLIPLHKFTPALTNLNLHISFALKVFSPLFTNFHWNDLLQIVILYKH